MKKLFLILLLAIGYFAQAQDLPTEPSNGFSFPLGSKFTIKLTAVDSSNYDYSVIAFEAFHEIIDSWKNDDLFADKGADSTIVCYFCVGTHGDTEEEREKNMKIFLLMKNYTQMALKYVPVITYNSKLPSPLPLACLHSKTAHSTI